MRPLIPALVATLAAIALAAADDYPRHVRVSVQFIEVPHPVLTEFLAAGNTSGNALHEKAYALTNDGTAKLLETSVVVCKPGQKATIESFREFI